MAFSYNRGFRRVSGGKAALAAGILDAWLNSNEYTKNAHKIS